MVIEIKAEDVASGERVMLGEYTFDLAPYVGMDKPTFQHEVAVIKD